MRCHGTQRGARLFAAVLLSLSPVWKQVEEENKSEYVFFMRYVDVYSPPGIDFPFIGVYCLLPTADPVIIQSLVSVDQF